LQHGPNQTKVPYSGITRGLGGVGRIAPGDTLEGGTNKANCTQIYEEQRKNEVGEVKKVWGDTL